MTSHGYDELCPCEFIKKFSFRFAIVTVYVDDINLTRALIELDNIVAHPKSEFEMNDLEKT